MRSFQTIQGFNRKTESAKKVKSIDIKTLYLVTALTNLILIKANRFLVFYSSDSIIFQADV